MKKNLHSKLRLNRETLRRLEDHGARQAAGGCDVSQQQCTITTLASLPCTNPEICGATCTYLC